MNANSLIAARVPSIIKERFSIVAQRHGVSESVLLRRLVEDALVTAGETVSREPKVAKVQPPEKISVRLRPDDFRLLRERAEVRNIRPATYVALFVRAH